MTTEKPTVKYQLMKFAGKTPDDLSEQKLVFQCQFPPVTKGANKTYYKVFWYVNDHTSTIFASKAVTEDKLQETYLRGETGLNSIKLNIEVKIVFLHYFKLPTNPVC